eukprot:TRINITY_DN68123_c2_g2_i9.p1 TRINITY_DN68123_c2_g2~~TRINITY_DN68123_c2_g2_i9.p1  ORF type:complete len:199 (+),score=32.67 TRINITY_DN68123_c2_g2_i9:646-1242(+)
MYYPALGAFYSTPQLAVQAVKMTGMTDVTEYIADQFTGKDPSLFIFLEDIPQNVRAFFGLSEKGVFVLGEKEIVQQTDTNLPDTAQWVLKVEGREPAEALSKLMPEVQKIVKEKLVAASFFYEPGPGTGWVMERFVAESTNSNDFTTFVFHNKKFQSGLVMGPKDGYMITSLPSTGWQTPTGRFPNPPDPCALVHSAL